MTPPAKPPRGGTRDDRVTKAPPAGLYERLSGVPQHKSAVPSPVDEETTDPTATEFDKVVHRTDRAAKNSHAAATNSLSALTEIARVREAVREDIDDVNKRVDQAVTQIATVLADALKAQTDAMIEHQTLRVTTEVEIEKADKLATINDRVEGKKWTREMIGKVVAAFVSGGGVAAIIALLASRSC